MMLLVLVATASAAEPTSLPTIFFLEHGHEHVPAHKVSDSLNGAKIETVAAVPPTRLHSHLAESEKRSVERIYLVFFVTYVL